jgi:hypothetical protein
MGESGAKARDIEEIDTVITTCVIYNIYDLKKGRYVVFSFLKISLYSLGRIHNCVINVMSVSCFCQCKPAV